MLTGFVTTYAEEGLYKGSWTEAKWVVRESAHAPLHRHRTNFQAEEDLLCSLGTGARKVVASQHKAQSLPSRGVLTIMLLCALCVSQLYAAAQVPAPWLPCWFGWNLLLILAAHASYQPV